jgi:predicted amidohydrolase
MELAKELAFSEDDARLAPLVEAATATSMTLVVGAPIRIGSRLHIGAFILYPDLTRAIHTKRHLGAFSSDVNPNGSVPPAENTVFERGTLSPLVRTGGPLGAVGICAESMQPEVPKEAAERGAKSYLTSHFGVPSDLQLRLKVLRTYAVQYGMAVVFANYGGPTGGLAASGGSAILSPSGELLVQLGRQGAGVVVASEDETGWSAKKIEFDGAAP